VATLAVRHSPASAAIVRQKLTDALQRAGLTADQAFDAALIATELVGNAVLHGRPLPSGDITVEWHLSAEGYYIAVTDGGHSAAVEAKEADSREVSGRGLMIVAALSQEWGVINTGNGTKVWAQASLASKGASTEPIRSSCHA
jgi:anti-sigma regulatory factor (Ser/Thr protein kinase)